MVLVIAGDRSGSGKTTVTLALLAALSRRAATVQSFKVGPDYIDPMFHQAVTGRPCRNLDSVLTSEAYVGECFWRHAPTAEYALVEGVMGLFDGASGKEDVASTAHIARLLDLPVLLVLDASRLSRSIAAIAHGYRSFAPRVKIAGVVLNRVGSDRHLELLKEALNSIEMPILGVLRRQDNITIPDRHLGLIPTDELDGLPSIFDRLAHLGNTGFNWETLLPLLKTPVGAKPLGDGLSVHAVDYLPTASPLQTPNPEPQTPNPNLRIAIARDRAFSFYYADNLDLLQQLGVQLVPWSPMADCQLPEQISGLYFGGGFPEVFAAELSANLPARKAVKMAVESGMPTYAECGGLMYLARALIDFEGQSRSMVGILPTTAVMGGKLTLGYRQALALRDSPLLPAGSRVWGHEFHRSHLQNLPPNPLFQLHGFSPAFIPISEGWKLHQLHASYLHLHWGTTRHLPQRFLQHCDRYSIAVSN
ncbi:MAG TPA: cobyrinate a,c-diamide synthase [Oscillatoriales cyanobacterium M59_W2019_021]|nr:cobyrinate a,c-diamide synthase [Oscillatoriales cyanobacterium M59_W2019_021]